MAFMSSKNTVFCTFICSKSVFEVEINLSSHYADSEGSDTF